MKEQEAVAKETATKEAAAKEAAAQEAAAKAITAKQASQEGLEKVTPNRVAVNQTNRLAAFGKVAGFVGKTVWKGLQTLNGAHLLKRDESPLKKQYVNGYSNHGEGWFHDVRGFDIFSDAPEGDTPDTYFTPVKPDYRTPNDDETPPTCTSRASQSEQDEK